MNIYCSPHPQAFMLWILPFVFETCGAEFWMGPTGHVSTPHAMFQSRRGEIQHSLNYSSSSALRLWSEREHLQLRALRRLLQVNISQYFFRERFIELQTLVYACTMVYWCNEVWTLLSFQAVRLILKVWHCCWHLQHWQGLCLCHFRQQGRRVHGDGTKENRCS